VLNTARFNTALGRSQHTRGGIESGIFSGIPAFLALKSLEPFISEELKKLSMPP
jgi:hypothetical protein